MFTPELSYAVSLILFLSIVLWKFRLQIIKALDDYCKNISNTINQARKSKEKYETALQHIRFKIENLSDYFKEQEKTARLKTHYVINNLTMELDQQFLLLEKNQQQLLNNMEKNLDYLYKKKLMEKVFEKVHMYYASNPSARNEFQKKIDNHIF